jgi:hypothetical protein
MEQHYGHSCERGKWAGIGFIAGAVVAIAIGKHVFYGPQGERNRHHARLWTLRAKAELLERMGEVQDLTEERYGELVDEVIAKYAAMKEVDAKKARGAGKIFKQKWKEMRKRIEEAQEETEEALKDEA